MFTIPKSSKFFVFPHYCCSNFEATTVAATCGKVERKALFIDIREEVYRQHLLIRECLNAFKQNQTSRGGCKESWHWSRSLENCRFHCSICRLRRAHETEWRELESFGRDDDLASAVPSLGATSTYNACLRPKCQERFDALQQSHWRKLINVMMP